jgi:mono/diheme cytochrome c family protein
MSNTPWQTGPFRDRRRSLTRPTGAQVLRQLGIVVLVAAVWGVILFGYLRLTDTPAESPVAANPTPSATPVPTATATPEPTDEPPTATPTQIIIETPVDEGTGEATAAPSTPTPLPTNTPIPTATEPPPTEPPPTEPPVAAISFADEVLPVFQSRCVQCHGPDRIENGVRLDTFTNVMAGSNSGPILIPGDAGASVLVQMIVSGDMPRRGPRLLPGEIETISEWVNAGAPDN